MLHTVQLMPIYKPKTMLYDIEPAYIHVCQSSCYASCRQQYVHSSPCPSATMTSTLTCHHIVMFIYIWIFSQKTMKTRALVDYVSLYIDI